MAELLNKCIEQLAHHLERKKLSLLANGMLLLYAVNPKVAKKKKDPEAGHSTLPPTPKRCGCGQISQPLQILQFPHLSGWVITPWPSCLQGLLQGRRMLKTQSSSQVLAIVVIFQG